MRKLKVGQFYKYKDDLGMYIYEILGLDEKRCEYKVLIHKKEENQFRRWRKLTVVKYNSILEARSKLLPDYAKKLKLETSTKEWLK